MSRGGTLTLLHTAPRHVAVFEDLNARAGGPFRLSHIVREDLLARAISAGRLPDDTRARAVRLLHEATAASDAVLCTCSTLGPCADEADDKSFHPVFRIDRPMAREAVTHGREIAVLATLACTLEPTSSLICDEASKAGVKADIAPVEVKGAWEAMEAGDTAKMHALIAEAAQLAAKAGADVIVLAQASMADALEGVSLPVPVLTSPESGFRAVVEMVAS